MESGGDLVPICASCRPAWSGARRAPELSNADDPAPFGLTERADEVVAAEPASGKGALEAEIEMDVSLELALRSMESAVFPPAEPLPRTGPPKRDRPRPPARKQEPLPPPVSPPSHIAASKPEPEKQSVDKGTGFSLRSDAKIAALSQPVPTTPLRSERPKTQGRERPAVGAPKTLVDSEMIRFKRRTPVRDFTRSLLGALAALGIVGLGVVGVFYAVQGGFLVLPEEQVAKISRFVKERVGGATGDNVDRLRLPDDFDWWLEQLRIEKAEAIRSLPPERSAYELCWRGRSRMLLLGDDDLMAARDQLEIAVLLKPKNVLALAGLAEVYSLVGVSDTSRSELLVWAQWLLRRADSLGGYGLERTRARAQWLLSGGEDKEAAELIREALRTHPDDAHFYFLHGIAQASDQGATAVAIGAFKRALELEPEMGRVWLEIGRMEERRHRYGPAAKAYREELASGTAGSGTHRALGLLMERVGLFDEASEHYRRSVALDPVQAGLALRRAVIAYQVDGKTQQAREILRRVLAGEHGQLGLAQRQEVKVHLSAVLRLAGDYRSAIRIAEELLIDEASYAPALFHLGLAQVQSGEWDQGEGTLLRLDSSGFTSLARARVHFHAGQAALLRGRTPDAIAGFGRAIDARPDFLPAYFWLLVAQLGRGDEEVVAESMLRFLGRDPLEWSRPRELSLTYGPVPKGREVAGRIMQAVPASRRGPKLSLALAIAQFHSGELGAAEELLRSVLAQDARSEGAKFYLGLIALSRQQADVAVLFLESVLETAHNNAVCHAYLGEALRMAGRTDEAVESLERARAMGDNSSWLDTRSGVIQAKRGLDGEAVTLLERAEAAAPDALDPRVQRYRLGL